MPPQKTAEVRQLTAVPQVAGNHMAPEQPPAAVVPTPTWTDQTGTPELAALRYGEENGEKKAGSYAAVAADTSLQLRRSEAISFTVTHEFAILEEPVGMGVASAGIFPPDLDRTLQNAGRRLFSGQPPAQALAEAAREVLLERTRARPSLVQNVLRQLKRASRVELPEGRFKYEIDDRQLAVIEADAIATAMEPNPRAVLALENGEWQAKLYQDLQHRKRVEGALLAEARIDEHGLGENSLDALYGWGAIAGQLFVMERLAIAREAEELDRELGLAARQWQRHFRSYYASEEDAIPEHNGNPHVEVNQPHLLFRQLAAVWPDGAVWPMSSWPTAPEDFATLARQAETSGDHASLLEIQRNASVRAAVGRILKLGDEYRSAPRERGRERRETMVDRVLRGLDFMPTLGKDIPEAAAARFAELVVRFCRNLDRK